MVNYIVQKDTKGQIEHFNQTQQDNANFQVMSLVLIIQHTKSIILNSQTARDRSTFTVFDLHPFT